MIILVIFLFFIVTFSSLYFLLRKKTPSSSACSHACSGKGCAEKNECGESCLSSVCFRGETCYKGNCCKPVCTGKTCGESSDDGCGGTCACPDGQTCYKGECCSPPDCSGGKCSDEEVCGVKCGCNSSYCTTDCCKDGKCVYEDVCNSSNGPLLKLQWGKFCNSCKNCKFENASFYKDSSIPISGTISCDSCTKNDGTQGRPTSVEISQEKCFYDSFDGVLYESPGGCGDTCANYYCWTDSDCERNGCNKGCVNGRCSA